MYLEYAWLVGKREEKQYAFANIDSSIEELAKIMETTDLDGENWSRRVGLRVTHGKKTDITTKSYRVRDSMFLYSEYMNFCIAIEAWLKTNAKQGVRWGTRYELACSDYSTYVMSMRIWLSNDYTSNYVTIGLPHKSLSETKWNYWADGPDTRENIPFRGDWVGLVKDVCRRLGKLELMENIEPPTSLRDLFTK